MAGEGEGDEQRPYLNPSSSMDTAMAVSTSTSNTYSLKLDRRTPLASHDSAIYCFCLFDLLRRSVPWGIEWVFPSWVRDCRLEESLLISYPFVYRGCALTAFKSLQSVFPRVDVGGVNKKIPPPSGTYIRETNPSSSRQNQTQTLIAQSEQDKRYLLLLLSNSALIRTRLLPLRQWPIQLSTVAMAMAMVSLLPIRFSHAFLPPLQNFHFYFVNFVCYRIMISVFILVVLAFLLASFVDVVMLFSLTRVVPFALFLCVGSQV